MKMKQIQSLKPVNPSKRIQQALVWGLMISMVMTPAAFSESFKTGIQFTQGSFRIGPSDVLSLKVYHQPDMDQENILVREDGNATFNGVGELFVAGKTVDEVSQMLHDRIGELVIDPLVTVNVTQTKPGSVYLAGAVIRPGMVQLGVTQATLSSKEGMPAPVHSDLKLSNVLASAGGVTMNADLAHVEVRRANSGTVQEVNLWKMLKEGSHEEDVWLQSGDSVFVPEQPQTAMSDADYNLLLKSSIGPGTIPVRIIGEVTTPGVYSLNGTSSTLNTAIASAGGYKESANKKMVAIRRFENNGAPKTITLDPASQDIVLRPNDIVYISEHGVYKAGRFLSTLARVFAPFQSAASATLPYVIWSRQNRR